MLWIKRNLVLVVGGAVSLGLLGYAVFFLWTQYRADKEVQDQLNAEAAEFDRFDTLPFYPSQQNIATAKAETEKVNAYLGKARGTFKPSPTPNVNMRDLKNLLDTAIFELTKKAESTGVALPARYTFSFEQQTKLMTFQAASVRPLAEQLAEVRAFCPIFFDAKINRLEAIRRYRVSTDDPTSSTDYLEQKPGTNALTKTVFVPYEVTFHSFTPELAAAIEGLMRHGFIVRALAVEPAPPPPVGLAEATPTPTPGYTPLLPTYPSSAAPSSMSPEMRARYGLGGGDPYGRDRYGRPGAGGSSSMSREMQDRYGLMHRPQAPAPTPAPAAVRPVVATGAKGLTTVLDEKLLRFTVRFDAMRQAK
jgi:hypothetical protein